MYFEAGAINADGNTWNEYFLKKLRLRRGEYQLQVKYIFKKSILKDIKLYI